MPPDSLMIPTFASGDEHGRASVNLGTLRFIGNVATASRNSTFATSSNKGISFLEGGILVLSNAGKDVKDCASKCPHKDNNSTAHGRS